MTSDWLARFLCRFAAFGIMTVNCSVTLVRHLDATNLSPALKLIIFGVWVFVGVPGGWVGLDPMQKD